MGLAEIHHAGIGGGVVSAAAKPQQGLPLDGSAGFADAAPVQLSRASWPRAEAMVFVHSWRDNS